MGYDGWVIVGTKLDSKQLERDLKQAERRLQQYEKEAERLTKAKAKAEIDLQPYEEQKRLIQESTDEMLKLAQTEEQVTNVLNMETTELEQLNQKYSKQFTTLNDINEKIKENAKNQALVTNEIEETNQKLNKAKGIGSVQDIMENVNKSTSSAIKKVGRWALAVFGVRSAYMFIRQAISTLSQYNEQMATDLEYIRFAIASSLQPLIESLINLAYKLLTYVNYIAQAWFGVNLFANASADAMNKSAKSAEKMKKSLAGFDEMNVISEDSSTGGAGGIGPTMDLSAPEDIQPPSWIVWIAENKDLILGALAGIALGLLAIKLADPTTWIVVAIATLGALATVVATNWETVKKTLSQVGSWIYNNIIKPVADFFSGLWNGIIDGVKGAVQWVKDAFSSVVNFFSNLISKIVNLFKNIGTKVGDAIGRAFKTVINGVLKAIESILNSPIKAINGLINTINKVPGINISKLSTFSLPRLAVGGVVNMPGRGVMVDGAVTGERGAEGVIPLTNSQMMAQLGEAIGKYVTINANITNTMNGRVISRELQKVNNNSNFAFNR